jgi:hypothetical protein
LDKAEARLLGSTPSNWASSFRRDAVLSPWADQVELEADEADEADEAVEVVVEALVTVLALVPVPTPGGVGATPLAISVAIAVSWSEDNVGAPGGGPADNTWARAWSLWLLLVVPSTLISEDRPVVRSG